MLERFQPEGVAPKLTSVGPTGRVDNANTQSQELRDPVLAPVAGAQRTVTELHPLGAPAQVMGQIRNEFDVIARSESDRKALDAIIGKLLPGYKALMDNIEAPALLQEAEKAVEELGTLRSKLSSQNAAPSSSSDGPDEGASPDAAPSAGAQNKVLVKIEAALRAVDDLQGKLSNESAGAHQRLLNIGASIGGLNMARMRVGDDIASAKSASAACDLIMTNVRSVVVAHGRLSPDMAKLVLG